MRPRRTARAAREIPARASFRIGEVAEIAGVQTHVLRFWESEFPSLRPGKTRSKHRMYSRKNVEEVLRIRGLLYDEGYTIEGARRQLRERARAATTPDPFAHPEVRAVIERLRQELEDLLQLVEE